MLAALVRNASGVPVQCHWQSWQPAPPSDLQKLSTYGTVIDNFSMITPRSPLQHAAREDHLIRAADLELPPYTLVHAEKAGLLERVCPGVYLGSKIPRHPLAEVAGWTLRQPAAVGGLLTAAVYHHLTDAFEGRTWLFVPIGASPPRSRMATLRVIQTAPAWVDPTCDAENGIQHLRVHGVEVRITGPDRTVLDLWRFPKHIPEEYALDALRRRCRAPDFHTPTFARLAQRLGIWRRIQPVLQGMMG